MPRKYQLTQNGEEVQALLNKIENLNNLSDLRSDSFHRTVTDAEKATWNGKQPLIPDLDAIRNGALLGATAYQKPVGGIPSSDLASGVIPDVSQFITKSVNNLTNYYLKSETYTKDEVASLIGAIQQFHYEIAASTSAVTNPQTNVLYLIGPTGSGEDKYEEYVYTNNTWTKIGDTSIDLSDYVTTQALNTALANYVTSDALATALAGLNDVKYTSQSLTDAQKAQARTNIGATAPEAFVATYGTTTYAEVAAAISDGKVVVVKRVIDEGTADEGVTFYGNLEELFGIYFFSCILFSLEGAATEIIAVDGTGWNSVGIKYLEDVARKVSSWSAVPNDSNYPSEKLVKDSLDGKQPTIDAQHKLDYSLIANTPTIPVLESMTTSEVTGAVNTAWDNVMNA